MEEQLEYYRTKLQNLKDNRAATVDTNTDAENELYDKLIEYTAEFCQSLNKLKEVSDKKDEAIMKMEEALKIIKYWKLPDTGLFWDTERNQPMSYEAAFGSNGVRDYMKSIANDCLLSHGGLVK
jgi:hypothetical protein